MAKNIEEVVKEASKDVIFDFKQVGEKPEEFSEWLECGEKGIPFEFFDGEIITLPPFSVISTPCQYHWGNEIKYTNDRGRV